MTCINWFGEEKSNIKKALANFMHKFNYVATIGSGFCVFGYAEAAGDIADHIHFHHVELEEQVPDQHQAAGRDVADHFFTSTMLN
jgi:hypothetical protein